MNPQERSKYESYILYSMRMAATSRDKSVKDGFVEDALEYAEHLVDMEKE